MADQIATVNWIQAAISVISALIVGYSAYLFNKRKYFDQEWWNKRIEKYEGCIALLSHLEQLYDCFTREFEEGRTIPKDKMHDYESLVIELSEYELVADFYFETKSKSELINLTRVIQQSDSDFHFENLYEQYEHNVDIARILASTKKTILQNDSKELRLS